MSGHVEHEVKLDADPALVLPELDGVTPGIHAVARPTLDLDATYFDAPDRRLLAAGLTVRRRTGEGTRWTVKLPAHRPARGAGSPAAAAVTRREVDVFDEGLDVPAEVVDLVADWLGDAPLTAVARLVSHRRRVALGLDPAGAEPMAELDDDLVTAEVHERRVGQFREIEIEQVDAEDDTAGALVQAVAARLVAAGARPSPSSSKLARALALAGRS